jgi:hypothetical protein
MKSLVGVFALAVLIVIVTFAYCAAPHVGKVPQ